MTDRRKALLKLSILVGLIVGGVLVARFTVVGQVLSVEGVGRAVSWLRGSPWAPAIFIAAYATATALAVPGTVLTLAGGAVFGVFWGTIFNSIAANLGANAAFLIARSLGRDGVRGLMGDSSSALEKLDSVVGEHGFRGLLTLRLIPLVPFNALNFGSGLMPLRWRTYALATVIGIFPGTLVYTFFADALLQGSQEASQAALVRVILAGGLLVLLSFTPAILKRFNIRLPGMAMILLMATAPISQTVRAQEPVRAQEADIVDHGALSRALQGLVSPDYVDYAGLAQRRSALDAYLSTLAAVSPEAIESAGRSQQLAFWINAYNACMLKRVLDNYPIKKAGGFLRIKNVAAGRPANSVWQIKDVFSGNHCEIASQSRSQDEIEHNILRPMGEPRIHFAVNCAAVSCPPLTATAYTGEDLSAQLDERVRAFMADSDQFSVDAESGTIRLNEILSWFGEDFGGPVGVKAFFAGYADGVTKAVLLDDGSTLEHSSYDWSLNDRSR